jgi:hypothetical protein
MTEQDWLSTTDPAALLTVLRASSGVSDRKLRLFLSAGYRKLPSPNLPGHTRRAALLIERYAEGQASRKELLDARSRAWDSATRFHEQLCRRRGLPTPEDRLHHACMVAVAQGTNPSVKGLFSLAIPALLEVLHERPWVANALHDLFGPLPFRPVEVKLPCMTPTLVNLARGVYEEGTFSTERLGVLADALEDAGCHDADVLGHCRQAGAVHVRGCFVVDLLLGKE